MCIDDSSEDDQNVNGDMKDIQGHLMHKAISRNTEKKLLTILKLQGTEKEHSHIKHPGHKPQQVNNIDDITL